MANRKAKKLYLMKAGMFFLLCSPSYLLAQSRQNPIVIKDNSCESNAAYFDTIHAKVQEGTSIITIARLGNSENWAVYNLRRLKVIKEYFRRTHPEYFKILVTAQGERIKGRGRVEFYVNGVLDLVFELRPKQNLKAGNCGY